MWLLSPPLLLLTVLSPLAACQNPGETVGAGPSYEQRLRVKLQGYMIEWREFYNIMNSDQAPIIQEVMYGDVGLARRARIMSKYLPTQAEAESDNTEQREKAMNRNIEHIVNKELAPDIAFLANGARKAERAARELGAAIQAMHYFYGVLKNIQVVFTKPNPKGEQFMPTKEEEEWLREAVKHLQGFWQSYVDASPKDVPKEKRTSLGALSIVSERVLQVVSFLETCFRENSLLLRFEALPVPLDTYFAELTKRNYDNKWWLQFTEKLRQKILQLEWDLQQSPIDDENESDVSDWSSGENDQGGDSSDVDFAADAADDRPDGAAAEDDQPALAKDNREANGSGTAEEEPQQPIQGDLDHQEDESTALEYILALASNLTQVRIAVLNAVQQALNILVNQGFGGKETFPALGRYLNVLSMARIDHRGFEYFRRMPGAQKDLAKLKLMLRGSSGNKKHGINDAIKRSLGIVDRKWAVSPQRLAMERRRQGARPVAF